MTCRTLKAHQDLAGFSVRKFTSLADDNDVRHLSSEALPSLHRRKHAADLS